MHSETDETFKQDITSVVNQTRRYHVTFSVVTSAGRGLSAVHVIGPASTFSVSGYVNGLNPSFELIHGS